jgi:hypothetical protein
MIDDAVTGIPPAGLHEINMNSMRNADFPSIDERDVKFMFFKSDPYFRGNC